MKDVKVFIPNDFKQICGWFKKRGLPKPSLKDLPMTGFIVDGIAAGFVYISDGSLGLIDCYISNPGSKKQDRSDALDLITERLVGAAKNLGCIRVKCDTQLNEIAIRALKHGFKEVGSFRSFIKEID